MTPLAMYFVHWMDARSLLEHLNTSLNTCRLLLLDQPVTEPI